MHRVFTFVLRQLVKRGEVCERDDPARIGPCCEAREVGTLGHCCHEQLLLHLRCLADRSAPRLGVACRSLELEPRALEQQLDVGAPVKIRAIVRLLVHLFELFIQVQDDDGD